jgi:polyhydroxyalkanoate synthesis regulator phasin
MLEELRKGLLSSLGAVFLTKDKIEDLCHKMVEEAKISKEDAQKLKDELLSTGENHWAEMERSISEELKKVFKNLDIVKGSDLVKVQRRIEILEMRMDAVERISGGQGPV